MEPFNKTELEQLRKIKELVAKFQADLTALNPDARKKIVTYKKDGTGVHNVREVKTALTVHTDALEREIQRGVSIYYGWVSPSEEAGKKIDVG